MEEGNWKEVRLRLGIFKLMKELGLLTEEIRKRFLLFLAQ
jgi:hypothetical protein